jgi:SnoaL-like domain
VRGEETTKRFDFGALRGAIERRDADALLDFYAKDSELHVVNGDAPEGPPFELKGISQLERYLRAVCDQEMSCVVEGEVSGEVVSGEGSISFVEVCAYPDGRRVAVRTTLEVDEGKILRQTDVVRSAYRDDESERRER